MSDAAFDLAFCDVFEDILGWDLKLTDDDGPGTVESWNSLAHIRLVHALEEATFRFERIEDFTMKGNPPFIQMYQGIATRD